MKITLPFSNRQISPELYGMVLILGSTLFFAFMGASVRLVREDFRFDCLVFYRCLIQFGLFTPWMVGYFRKNPQIDSPTRLKFHLFRSGFGVAAMLCFYFALSKVPLALGCLLSTTSVFWATLLAWVFLKEKASWLQVAFALVIFLGMIVSVWNVNSTGGWVFAVSGVVFGLLGGSSRGVAMVALRRLRMDIGSGEIVFAFGVVGIIVTLPGFLYSPQIPASADQAGLILSIGVLGTAGQFLMTTGFKYTRTLLASSCSLQVTLVAIAVGFYLLEEVPPITFFVGTVLVIGGLMGLVKSQPEENVSICPNPVQ